MTSDHFSRLAPKELADVVRRVLPYVCVPERLALEVLEDRATTKEPLEARVARLEEKAATKTVAAVDPGFKTAGVIVENVGGQWRVPPHTIASFKYDLAGLCNKHMVRADLTSIRSADLTSIRKVGNLEEALFSLSDRPAGQEPLPPAESCAHAVERFREALLLLTKRHEVEVGVRFICPSAAPGITDLPHPSESFDEAVRERKAWDAIEAWQDRATAGTTRQTATKKFGQKQTAWLLVPPSFSLTLSERVEARGLNCKGMIATASESKSFKLPSRLAALEAAAAWCEGQS